MIYSYKTGSDGHLAKMSRLWKNRFMDYCYVPLIDVLTEGRQYIKIRSCCYILLSLTFTCFVECQSCQKLYLERSESWSMYFMTHWYFSQKGRL